MDDRLSTLTQEILAFRDERDWAQFHTPRNLAAALSIEAAELQEAMLWKDDTAIAEMLATPDRRVVVEREIADVLIYALLLCSALGGHPDTIIREKLRHNAAKYPVERSRGVSTKYTDL